MKEKIKLTANILFSGIGCQERGFQDSGLFDIDVLTTSEISKEAVLSYAAVHCGLTAKMVDTYENYPSREEMAQYLTDINLGYEPDKNKEFDWFKLIKRKSNDLEKYWLACKLTNNLGDISKIEELPYADFWTISFPCQSISVAGKMKGFKPDSGTRSSLLWENIRLLNTSKTNGKLPKYLMFENVKNLVSKRFINDFYDLLDVLDELGFNSYWQVINGKDCGVPQNRERVFVISIRKDIDNKTFTFPKPFDTGIRLKDILEEKVDEKYYLSDIATRKFKLFPESKGINIRVAGSLNPNKSIQDRVRILDVNGITQTLTATDYKDPIKIIQTIDRSTNDEDRDVSNRKSEGTAVLEQIGQIYGTDKEPNPQAGRIYNSECLSPTLDSCSGGNRMPKIIQVGQVKSNGSLEQYIETIINCMDLLNIMQLKGWLIYRNKTIREILSILWKEIREETIQWQTRGFWCIQEEEILQHRLYEQIQVNSTESRCELDDITSDSKKDKSKDLEKNKVRDLWNLWQARCASYKLELERQFINEFTGFMSQLSQQNTQTQKRLLDMWATDERTRLLQQALYKVQKVWMSFDDEEKPKCKNCNQTLEDQMKCVNLESEN